MISSVGDQRVAVIIGSTRPTRICPSIAAWVRDALAEESALSYELIDRYNGFVFVLPQYNWGYPAPLKNALDFLYREWHDKPATTVTYGTRGGIKAAEQMNEILLGLHMRPLPTRLEIVITDHDVDARWQLTDLEATTQPYRAQLRKIDTDLVEALVDDQN